MNFEYFGKNDSDKDCFEATKNFLSALLDRRVKSISNGFAHAGNI